MFRVMNTYKKKILKFNKNKYKINKIVMACKFKNKRRNLK